MDTKSIPVAVLGNIEQTLLDTMQYDTKASIRGDNAFYHYCDAMQGRSNYAVCLHTIAACRRADKNSEELRPQCYESIKKGNCPALVMRRNEVAAGRSLYFIDRNEVMRMRDEEEAKRAADPVVTFRRGAQKVEPLRGNWVDDREFAERVESASAQAPTKKSDANDDLMVGDIAHAINKFQESQRV